MALTGKHTDVFLKKSSVTPFLSLSVLVPTKNRAPLSPLMETDSRVTLSWEPDPGTSSPIRASVNTPVHSMAHRARSLCLEKSIRLCISAKMSVVRGSLFLGPTCPNLFAAAAKVRSIHSLLNSLLLVAYPLACCGVDSLHIRFNCRWSVQ